MEIECIHCHGFVLYYVYLRSGARGLLRIGTLFCAFQALNYDTV